MHVISKIISFSDTSNVSKFITEWFAIFSGICLFRMISLARQNIYLFFDQNVFLTSVFWQNFFHQQQIRCLQTKVIFNLIKSSKDFLIYQECSVSAIIKTISRTVLKFHTIHRFIIRTRTKSANSDTAFFCRFNGSIFFRTSFYTFISCFCIFCFFWTFRRVLDIHIFWRCVFWIKIKTKLVLEISANFWSEVLSKSMHNCTLHS